MKIQNNALPLETYMKVRRAMADTSAITPVNRLKFRRLLPADQAKMVGIYAKFQLRSADKLISQNMWGKAKPTAVYLWFRVLANTSLRPAENIKTDINGDQLMIETINKLYPKLSVVSRDITQLFTGSFRYWVDNFFSCDKDGKHNLFAFLNSMARNLSKSDIQMINDESNMPYLGEHIKRYADNLLSKSILMVDKKTI